MRYFYYLFAWLDKYGHPCFFRKKNKLLSLLNRIDLPLR